MDGGSGAVVEGVHQVRGRPVWRARAGLRLMWAARPPSSSSAMNAERTVRRASSAWAWQPHAASPQASAIFDLPGAVHLSGRRAGTARGAARRPARLRRHASGRPVPPRRRRAARLRRAASAPHIALVSSAWPLRRGSQRRGAPARCGGVRWTGPRCRRRRGPARGRAPAVRAGSGGTRRRCPADSRRGPGSVWTSRRPARPGRPGPESRPRTGRWRCR